jgi:nitrite reductase (NADH) small subunit
MTITQNAPAQTNATTWIRVCSYTDLLPERGAAALVAGHQIAVFRTFEGEVYAVGNRDPFSGAYVLSRGIVGTMGDEPVIVTPMHKQAFSLVTGICLDDPATTIPIYRVRVTDGDVEVGAV